MNSMRVIKYIFFFLCLYIYIYNPILQILGFGSIKILLFISLFYFFVHKETISFLQNYKKEMFYTFLLIIYLIPIVFLGDGTATMIPYTHLIWFLECFIIPLFLLFYFKNIFQKYQIESLLVIIGTIASLITFFLINNPEINTWIRQSVIVDTLDKTSSNWDFRGFTFAESSSYAYGVVQGIMLALCLISIRKSYLYAIPIIPIFISILFNARIGFSVLIIALALMLIFKRLKIKYVIIGAITVLSGVVLYNNSSFVSENSTSLEWGLGFFEDTFALISGGDASETNYEVLSNRMFFLPENFVDIIFGEGRIVFGDENLDSDIGYVNQIFTGGIVYLLIMLSFLWYMYNSNVKITHDKLLPLLFMIVLLVVNIKGNAFFLSNGFFRMFTLYYIYSMSVYLKPLTIL